MTLREVVDAIRTNPFTLVVVSSEGVIVIALPFRNVPDTKQMMSLAKTYKGHSAQFFPQSEVTEETLQKEIDGLAEAIRLGRSGKLKPGASLVDRHGHIEWAQDAARRRLLRQKKRSVR